jgi:hypothetical protein
MPQRLELIFASPHFYEMPIYYFDLEDGANVRDTKGAELANDAAAKQEATLRALNGSGHQLEHYNGFRAIIVRNSRGEEIFRKRIR